MRKYEEESLGLRSYEFYDF